MSRETKEAFKVIGIAVRTTNEHGQSAKDIPALWNKFVTEACMAKIPNKIDETVYGMYTDYELDHTKPYTAIIGCAVSTLDNVPEGMVGKEIEASTCEKFVAKGSILQGVVFSEWLKIWSANLDRAYTADYEVYGEKAKNPADAEVDIFVAVH